MDDKERLRRASEAVTNMKDSLEGLAVRFQEVSTELRRLRVRYEQVRKHRRELSIELRKWKKGK